jgi:hypothetical protein
MRALTLQAEGKEDQAIVALELSLALHQAVDEA